MRKLARETAQTLPDKSAMTLIDLFIIYLTCGAPFGVYYFLQNRTLEAEMKRLWFKTILNFLFWIPFALLLLRRNEAFNSEKASAKDSNQEANFRLIEKQLEKILLTGGLKISIYECRETLERYVGLTIANQASAMQIAEAEKEFFRVTKTEMLELGAICLNRRNRKRLDLHQTEARRDFLNLINKMSESGSDVAKLKHWSIELAVFLEDRAAQEKLELMFADATQIANRLNVKNTEKILWKPAVAAPKPSPAKQISYQLPAMKAMLNSRKKD